MSILTVCVAAFSPIKVMKTNGLTCTNAVPGCLPEYEIEPLPEAMQQDGKDPIL